MLRALGLRRMPLIGAFATEGWMYSVAAGAAGSLAGIGFGWVIAWRASDYIAEQLRTRSI